MNRDEVIVQISTGGYLERKVTYREICRKLEPLLNRIKVGKVILGWCCDKEIYEAVIRLLRDYQVQSFLWLPVFSETGLMKPESVGRLISHTGEEVRSFGLTEGENFEFYCPNQRNNGEAFLQIYKEQFEGLEFDGVFLDKIRYGAFSNGLGGVFNCFCETCKARYEAEGLDTEVLRAEMEKVAGGEDGYGERVLGIKSYNRGRYTFEHPIWERFFEKKARDVEEALKVITAYFHDKGMLIGMDTFAPYLAYFAGQDVARLASMADFIKPMMYRITQAPAGLPFETDCLVRETVKAAQEKAGDLPKNQSLRADHDFRMGAREAFLEVLGCGGMKDGQFDTEFVKRELTYMAELPTRVYCGTEINRNQSAHSTPGYIRQTFREFKDCSIDGYVLSWDLLSATAENVAAAAEYFERERGDGQ